jgi:hypothetical protein
MIVIDRHGKTIVITGWRAWLIGAAIFAAVSIFVAFIVFVLLGAAITIGVILLIVVPIFAGIALIASAFQRLRPPL